MFRFRVQAAGIAFLARRGRPFLAAVVLGLVLLGGAGVPGAWAQNTSPRGAQHEGYGRLVFDWDGPVTYSADVAGGNLVVRFDRPINGDIRRVLRPLSHYLRSASVSDDRRVVTFTLERPIQAKAYVNGIGSVVVDLTEDPAPPAAPSPEPAKDGGPVSLLPQSDTGASSSSAEAKPAAPARGDASLAIRVGEHGSYSRLVFEWPRAVRYTVDQKGDQATLTFARAARVDTQSLKAQLPSDIAVARVDSAAATTTLVLALPPKSRVRHFASAAKVVLDVVRDASGGPPAGTIAMPVGSDNDPGLPALKPLGDQKRPTLPSETLAGAPAKTAPPSGAAPAPVENPPPPPVAGSSTNAPVASQHDGETYSLSVAWEKPVAAAVFMRAGYLWLVFDRHRDVDIKLLKRQGGAAVTFAEQLPSRDATIIRMIVQPEFRPSVRRDSLLWVIDLAHQASEPAQPIAITAPAALASGAGIALAVADAGPVVAVADPEVGDTMEVVPVMPLGAGVYPGRDTPDVQVLATVQGIALVPHLDGIDVKSSRSGVTIASSGNGGLRLSRQAAQTAAAVPAEPQVLFDIPAWKRGGVEHFAEERRLVDQDLAAVAPSRRGAANLSAARFFLANGFAAEALGYLRVAAQYDPTMVDQASFRAVRGAANTLMQRWDQATFDLDSPLLKDDAEAQFWAAVAHARSGGDPTAFEKPLAAGLPFLKNYPKALQWPLATTVASVAIAASDDGAAQAALDVVDRTASTPAEKGWREYLRGSYDEFRGKFDRALDHYAKARVSANREAAARASLAEVELRLKLKTISLKDAESRLDRLRFAWRDEDFEFGLLRRLAELEEKDGNYPEALRSLRSLANYYPDNKGAPAVARQMQDIFARLYLGGGADSMPPVSAIALYDEFRDLTPTGAMGDEMIRKLADRLVSVDLLDRASELLKHQVTYRLQGTDKARVGTQLAILDLLDQKPRDALDALAASEVGGLPADLALQRRHLKANALAYADRVPEAIALLAGDGSTDAALLRAEIYWRKKDWANAALAFEALVQKPAPGTVLDDASARLVLSWATALILGKDEHGLGALRRNFASSMAGTPYRDGFQLLSSALDRGIPDLAAVGHQIREVENFKTFLGAYQARLKKEGLSAIN